MIEQQNSVKIIYACESGSRAWGFASTDSDFDVRFIYVHPIDWYLTIDEGRDVIEKPIDNELDISGWDIKKALGLLKKSNPPLLEWLQSPIVYEESAMMTDILRRLVSDFYSPISSSYHYLSMAKRNHRAYLQGDIVSRKKYFYVLRPILACRWIELREAPVPMEFEKLLMATISDGQLEKAIKDLLELKKSGTELGKGPKIPIIDDFLEEEIERLSQAEKPAGRDKADIEKLNQAFREIVKLAH